MSKQRKYRRTKKSFAFILPEYWAKSKLYSGYFTQCELTQQTNKSLNSGSKVAEISDGSRKALFASLTFIRSEAFYLHRSAFFPRNLVTSQLNTAPVWDGLSRNKPSNTSRDSFFPSLLPLPIELRENAVWSRFWILSIFSFPLGPVVV